MATLVAMRAETVHTAERTIREANEWFDQEAKPLGRRIAKLRGDCLPDKQPPKKRKPTMDVKLPSDWSVEEQQHFIELQRKASQ